MLEVHVHKSQQLALSVAIILILAGISRFVGLGTWSFANDELATIWELDSLYGREVTQDRQTFALPRTVPVYYAILELSISALGRSEFSSRLPAALFGTMLCGLAVFLAWPFLGNWGSTGLGCFLTFCPDYMFHSQNNRFYIAAAFIIAVIALLLNRVTISRLVLACVLMCLGTFVHTLTISVSFVIIISTVATRNNVNSRGYAIRISIVAAFIVLSLLLFNWLSYPYLKGGWNTGQMWGYSVPRAILGAMNQIGWTTILLVMLGVCYAFVSKWEHFRYWFLWLFAWVMSIVILPMIVVYHPGYSFIFSIGPLVFASYFVNVIANLLPFISLRALWTFATVLFLLPSIISYYADGSRFDFRSAANYLVSQQHEGEAIKSVSPGFLLYYANNLENVSSLGNDELGKQMEKHNRGTWIVITAGRTGLRYDDQAWLNANALLKQVVKRNRYDYYEFVIYIYYYKK